MDYHPGPLIQGDVIVIEIGGKIVPKRPWDSSPQWFVVRDHQKGAQQVPLLPIDDNKALEPRIYRATWGG